MSFSLSMAFWLARPRDTYDVKIILWEQIKRFMLRSHACMSILDLFICSDDHDFFFTQPALPVPFLTDHACYHSNWKNLSLQAHIQRLHKPFVFVYLHFSKYEWQSKGLGCQVAQSGPCRAGEAGHTHSCHIKHSFSISKRPTRRPGERKGGANQRIE